MKALLLLLLLLLAALPAPAAAERGTVHYYDHDYRVTFGLSGAVERLTTSSGPVRLDRVVSTITYTNGARFVIWDPDGLRPGDLNGGASYEFEERLDILEGGNSVLLPPRSFGASISKGGLEEIAAKLGAEIVPAELLSGRTSSGKRFRVLYVPSRKEHRLWSPTCRMDHRVLLEGKRSSLTSIAVPLGLGAPTEDVVEEASHKDSNLLLSVGAGGRVAAAFPDGGLKLVIDYMSAAGTDVAALDSRDLKQLWLASRKESFKLPFTAPDLVASNVKISDPALAGLVKPYSIRRLGGRSAAFISLVPQDPETQAELAGTGAALWNPKDEEALGALVKELRETQGAELVVAVSFYRREDFGWLTSAQGVDVVIGPKNWESPAPRLTRMELDRRASGAGRGPALLVYPDSSGAGRVDVEFGRRGVLEAAEARPAPEEEGAAFDLPARNAMKELIISQVLGSGDSLLPDPRRMALHGGESFPFYAIPDFFKLSAGLLRRRLKAEVAVLRLNPNGSSVLGDTPSSMVKTWLGPDEPVELALVPGSVISGFLRKSVPDMPLPSYYSLRAFQGREFFAVSGTDTAGRVAGLPISPNELYLAALPASLLQGKTGVQRLPAPGLTLHGLVTGELRNLRKKAGADRKAWENAISDGVADVPEQRKIWRINLRSLSLQASNVGVSGPAGYASTGESRLSATDQTRIQGSGRLFSEFHAGRLSHDAGVSADYGKVVLRPKGQPSITAESVDQVAVESELRYRLRSFNGALGPLVVGPFASAEYETEFSRAEGQPLRKVLRGKAGLTLFEGTHLQAFYAGLTTEQVLTYSPARTKYAAETGFRLSWPVPGTALTLLADGNYRNFARSRFDTVNDLKDRLELNARVSTRLYGDITLNPFVSYFQATGKKLTGTASNLTTGFTLEYSRLFKLKR